VAFSFAFALLVPAATPCAWLVEAQGGSERLMKPSLHRKEHTSCEGDLDLLLGSLETAALQEQ
jgi:hypothetical protein